jgi:hypothetical protein
MIGSFTGSSVATKGHNVGQVTPLAINITSENAIGNLAGTLTTKDGTFPLTGTITLNGTFAGKLFNPKNGTITLAGHFNASTLSGTYISSKDSGTFNVVETP